MKLLEKLVKKPKITREDVMDALSDKEWRTEYKILDIILETRNDIPELTKIDKDTLQNRVNSLLSRGIRRYKDIDIKQVTELKPGDIYDKEDVEEQKWQNNRTLNYCICNGINIPDEFTVNAVFLFRRLTHDEFKLANPCF